MDVAIVTWAVAFTGLVLVGLLGALQDCSNAPNWAETVAGLTHPRRSPMNASMSRGVADYASISVKALANDSTASG